MRKCQSDRVAPRVGGVRKRGGRNRSQLAASTPTCSLSHWHSNPRNRGSTGQRRRCTVSLVRLQQGFRDGLGPVSWAVKWSEQSWQGSTTASSRAPLSHSREKKKRSTCRWVGFRIGPPPPIIQVNYGFRGRWMLIRRQELGRQTSHVWPPNLRLWVESWVPLFKKKSGEDPETCSNQTIEDFDRRKFVLHIAHTETLQNIFLPKVLILNI